MHGKSARSLLLACGRVSEHLSENDSRAQSDNAGRGFGRRGIQEIRRIDIQIGDAEVGMIESVGGFGSNLHLPSLGDGEVFVNGEVDALEHGRGQRVAADAEG